MIGSVHGFALLQLYNYRHFSREIKVKVFVACTTRLGSHTNQGRIQGWGTQGTFPTPLLQACGTLSLILNYLE